MASIPQQQISDAYYYCLRHPNEEHGFGRGYVMWYNGNHTFILEHYGTEIYRCDTSTKKFRVGGYSYSDVMAINSLAYHTGVGGAYIEKNKLYAKGTGPRYEKKNRTNAAGIPTKGLKF